MAQAPLFDPSTSSGEVGDKVGEVPQTAPVGKGTSGASTESWTRLKWMQEEVAASEPGVNRQREQGKECSRFVAGDQLDDATRAELKGSRRPDTAINVIQKYVHYVSGMQRRSPQALVFRPTVVDDRIQQLIGEYDTQTYEWAYRLAEGQDAVSRVFFDSLVTGLGFSDKYLDTLRDPRGIIRYVRVPWDEVYYPECSELNLGGIQGGTRWRARESWIEKDEAIRRWPDHEMLIRSAAGLADEGRDLPQQDIITYIVPYVQSVPISGRTTESRKRNAVKVLQFQWYEDQAGMHFTDPVTGEPMWLSLPNFFRYRSRLKQTMPGMGELDSDKGHHRVVQVQYLLDRKHELSKPARLPGDQFSLQALTGHWNHADRLWYGFARLGIDPQKFANAFFRQTLEIMAISAKGGMEAQTDAFKNLEQLREYRKTFAVPGSINLVAPEALEKNKIRPKPKSELPQGAFAMLQFCMASLPDAVTGMNATALGDIGAGDGSAMTMRQSQQVGRTILAHEFDSLGAYRRDEGRGFISFLSLIADGRMVRIGGQDAAGQVVPLLRKPYQLEYDVWIDDTENDPNMRTLAATSLREALPMLSKGGYFVPEMLDILLPFLPWRMRQKMIQQVKQQAEQRQQMAERGINIAGRGQPKSPQEIAARTQKLQADAMLHVARAQAIPRESRREDLRAAIEAAAVIHQSVDASRRHEMDQQRHGLDRERHHLDSDRSAVQSLTQLLQTMQQPEERRGAEQ